MAILSGSVCTHVDPEGRRKVVTLSGDRAEAGFYSLLRSTKVYPASKSKREKRLILFRFKDQEENRLVNHGVGRLEKVTHPFLHKRSVHPSTFHRSMQVKCPAQSSTSKGNVRQTNLAVFKGSRHHLKWYLAEEQLIDYIRAQTIHPVSVSPFPKKRFHFKLHFDSSS